MDQPDGDAKVVAGAATIDRAVLATGASFTLADARLPDMPLAWVNPAFTAATGYSFEESVGRNCRFLQGPETDPATVATMSAALAAGGRVSATVLNYRRDGSTFWNDLTIDPVLDSAGQLTHFVGMQVDVSVRIEAESSREQALRAELHAVRQVTAAHAGLALLAEASSQLAVSFDADDSLDRLASLVVRSLADWVVVHRLDASGTSSSLLTLRHSDGHEELTARYGTLLAAEMSERGRVPALGRVGASWMMSDSDPTEMTAGSPGEELTLLSEQLGVASTIVVALPGRRGTVGTMVLNRDRNSPRYNQTDFELAVDLGRRVGLSLDNARLYQEEHLIAETLQRSLLPTLPGIDGLEIAAHYKAAQVGIQVGGDFYDLMTLRTGRTGIVVGDVEGHDLAAAAAMGQLRGLIHASLLDDSPADDLRPDLVLRRVDHLVQQLDTLPMASVAYADLSLADADGSRILRHSSAGHPPLMVREPGGQARLLTGEPGLLLGVGIADRTTSTEVLAAGSTILAFTDGLVERRGADIDDGLELLRLLVENAPVDISPTALCERLIDWLGDSEDDTAVLAVRIDGA